MTDTGTPAPDQTVWWDTAATAAAALAVLRLEAGDVDADRVAELVDAAGVQVNNYLDRTGDDPVPAPPPADLADALTQIVVELYRRKDAPPSSIDGLIASSWRAPSLDPLAGVRSVLRRYKGRFGVA